MNLGAEQEAGRRKADTCDGDDQQCDHEQDVLEVFHDTNPAHRG